MINVRNDLSGSLYGSLMSDSSSISSDRRVLAPHFIQPSAALSSKKLDFCRSYRAYLNKSKQTKLDVLEVATTRPPVVARYERTGGGGGGGGLGGSMTSSSSCEQTADALYKSMLSLDRSSGVSSISTKKKISDALSSSSFASPASSSSSSSLSISSKHHHLVFHSPLSQSTELLSSPPSSSSTTSQSIFDASTGKSVSFARLNEPDSSNSSNISNNSRNQNSATTRLMSSFVGANTNSESKLEINFESDPLSESHLYLLSVSASSAASDSCRMQPPSQVNMPSSDRDAETTVGGSWSRESSSDASLEIRKLRQENQNLRVQVQMAEETNSQLSLEMESEVEVGRELRRRVDQLSNSLDQRLRENDLLRRDMEELTMRRNDLERQAGCQAVTIKELRGELVKSEARIAELATELNQAKEELAKAVKELSKQKNAFTELNMEFASLEQKLIEANIKIAQSDESTAHLNQTILDLRAEKEALVEKLDILNEKFAKSTSKLLSKTYLSNSTATTASSGAANQLRSTSFLSAENLDSLDESESLINLHIASNLNENTFHLSPNETNFYNERLRSGSRSMIGSNGSLDRAIEDAPPADRKDDDQQQQLVEIAAATSPVKDECGDSKLPPHLKLDSNNNYEEETSSLAKANPGAEATQPPPEPPVERPVLVARRVRLPEETKKLVFFSRPSPPCTNKPASKEKKRPSCSPVRSESPSTPPPPPEAALSPKSKNKSPSKEPNVFSRLYALISKDSFKRLRYTISICLILFSFVILAMTILQERDIYGSMLGILIENIEIKNLDNAKPRPN